MEHVQELRRSVEEWKKLYILGHLIALLAGFVLNKEIFTYTRPCI